MSGANTTLAVNMFGTSKGGDFANATLMFQRFQVSGGVTVDGNGARDERDPSQGALCSKARAEARATAVLVTRLGELPAHRLNCVRMQPKFRGASRGQFDQVKSRRPARVRSSFAPTLCLPLGRNTKVPDLIARNREAIEAPVAALNAVLERDYRHPGTVLFSTGNSTIERSVA